MTDDAHKPFSERFQEVSNTMPDKYTLAWWKAQWEEVQKGYRGVSHGLNSCRAEYGAFQEAVKKTQLQCEALEKRLDKMTVEFGRLQGRVTGVAESIEKARVAYSELHKLVKANEKS